MHDPIQAAFNRAAKDYELAARLQRQVSQQLLEDCALLQPVNGSILDLGAGTGMGTFGLTRCYPDQQIIALDFAPAMLQELQAKGLSNVWPVCGRAEALPLLDNSIALIWSSLVLQWCVDLPRVLAECRRVLRPGGQLLCATLGTGTLSELRQSWAQVDQHKHVNDFIAPVVFNQLIAQAGFKLLRSTVKTIRLTYPDVMALLRELKQLGANTVTRSTVTGMLGRHRLQAMQAHYARYCTPMGEYPASYQIIYLLAQA